MNCDPKSLLQAARCFCFLPRSEFNASVILTLCQWVNASSLDPDVQAFVDAAGITDAAQIAALSGLVSDLKTLPAAGTKYWDRQLLLYPFIGGTAARHSYNLMNPDLYQLTYHGTPAPLHSATGMAGSGVAATNGYANTHWRCPAGNIDNVCVMAYVEARNATAGSNRMVFGASTSTHRFYLKMDGPPYTTPMTYDLNNDQFGVTAAAGPLVLGAYFCQRIGDGSVSPSLQSAVLANAWGNANLTRTPIPSADVYLLATDSTGVAASLSDMVMSGFSVLSKLTNAERLEYKGIWDNFENALGRSHPLGV